MGCAEMFVKVSKMLEKVVIMMTYFLQNYFIVEKSMSIIGRSSWIYYQNA